LPPRKLEPSTVEIFEKKLKHHTIKNSLITHGAIFLFE
jgi:hypothetical protein